MMPKRTVAESTVAVLLFAGAIFAAALIAIALFRENTAVAPADIIALAAAVLGVIGTHLGHLAGHQHAERALAAARLMDDLDRLSALKEKGKLNDSVIDDAVKRRLDTTP